MMKYANLLKEWVLLKEDPVEEDMRYAIGVGKLFSENEIAPPTSFMSRVKGLYNVYNRASIFAPTSLTHTDVQFYFFNNRVTFSIEEHQSLLNDKKGGKVICYGGIGRTLLCDLLTRSLRYKISREENIDGEPYDNYLKKNITFHFTKHFDTNIYEEFDTREYLQIYETFGTQRDIIGAINIDIVKFIMGRL